MKTFVNFLLIFLFLMIQSAFVYSQNQTDVSKIIPGKKYKIVLFDDSEIIGKIISVDSLNIAIQTENKGKVIIPKNNILYYSTSTIPNKYNFSFALFGGVNVFSGDNNYYYFESSNSSKTGPSFNISFNYYLSDSKAIKLDAGYSYLNPGYSNTPSNVDPYGYYVYQGGNVSMFYFKGNIMVGTFVPEQRIIAYVSLGFGIHYAKINEFSSSYYNHDTLEFKDTYQARSDVHALVSLGASLGYRFTKHFGVQAEIEYHLVTGVGFLFFGADNYFPLKLGIFYTF